MIKGMSASQEKDLSQSEDEMFKGQSRFGRCICLNLIKQRECGGE